MAVRFTTVCAITQCLNYHKNVIKNSVNWLVHTCNFMNNFYDILSMYNVHIYYHLKLEDSLKNMATFIIYESCQVLEI
jgi:hypothetical protein